MQSDHTTLEGVSEYMSGHTCYYLTPTLTNSSAGQVDWQLVDRVTLNKVSAYRVTRQGVSLQSYSTGCQLTELLDKVSAYRVTRQGDRCLPSTYLTPCSFAFSAVLNENSRLNVP